MSIPNETRPKIYTVPLCSNCPMLEMTSAVIFFSGLFFPLCKYEYEYEYETREL